MAACTPTFRTRTPVASEPAPLARFMREMVNVPFAFAMLETDGRQRPTRVHKAAVVLRDAAHNLAAWETPPGASEAAREVFFEYARNLERHVARLELAAENHDTDEATVSLEQIRQTCNSCHRFFRPASETSQDVAYDRLAIGIGDL